MSSLTTYSGLPFSSLPYYPDCPEGCYTYCTKVFPADVENNPRQSCYHTTTRGRHAEHANASNKPDLSLSPSDVVIVGEDHTNTHRT